MRIRQARLVSLDWTKQPFVPEVFLGVKKRVFVVGSGPRADYHIKHRGIGSRHATFRYRPETECWSISRHFFQVVVNGHNLAFWQSVQLKDGDRIQVGRFHQWTFEFPLTSSMTTTRKNSTNSVHHPGENGDLGSIKMKLTRIRREKHALHKRVEEEEELSRKLTAERDRFHKRLDAERSLFISERKRDGAEHEKKLTALRQKLEEESDERLAMERARAVFERKMSLARGEAVEAQRGKLKEELVAKEEASKEEKRQMEDLQEQVVTALELEVSRLEMQLSTKETTNRSYQGSVMKFLKRSKDLLTCGACGAYFKTKPLLLQCGHGLCSSCAILRRSRSSAGIFYYFCHKCQETKYVDETKLGEIVKESAAAAGCLNREVE